MNTRQYRKLLNQQVGDIRFKIVLLIGRYIPRPRSRLRELPAEVCRILNTNDMLVNQENYFKSKKSTLSSQAVRQEFNLIFG